MKKAEVIKWAEENGLDKEYVLQIVANAVHDTNMSWQSLSLKTDTKAEISCTCFGYRKCTTGEYVSNAYRQNFGWKNTYYQNAQLAITFAA
jgi:hypothetical protein